MGAAGTFCGLAIYIGEKGINSYLKISSGNFAESDETEIKFSQQCIHLPNLHKWIEHRN